MSSNINQEDMKKKRIMAYERANGDIGIRNHILVLPTVICSVHVAKEIANAFSDNQCIYITHEHGCSQLGIDFEQTKKTLLGTALNPNVFAVLLIGLGCENCSANEYAKIIQNCGKENVSYLSIQEEGGTLNTIKKGKKIIKEFLFKKNKSKRKLYSLENIIMGTECGGSDAFSGITANIILGLVADKLVELGATVILSEVNEFIGAEHILKKRAINEMVKKQIGYIVQKAEKTSMDLGVDMIGSQPGPGNISGGISTIEEKSLGCIKKGGSTPIVHVYKYAQKIKHHGLCIMDTTGDDVRSLTGMAAGGCQLAVFTTGRGSPVGSPIIPVIKVSSNTKVYINMRENTDFDAGGIIDNNEEPIQLAESLFQKVLNIINGEETNSEKLHHTEFAIDRIAPCV